MRSEMCSLHLTHPTAHTPGAVDSQHCGTRGAVGGSVPCSRVSPQSWPEPRFKLTTSDYKSDTLSIRPRLPPVLCIYPILSAYAPGAVGSHVTAPGEQLGVRCLAQGHFSRGIELNSCRPETRTCKL